ncbi:hypothetical protein ABG088_00255, partial [Hydrogenibacillus schlegelii]
MQPMLVVVPDPFGQKRIEGFDALCFKQKVLMLCFETREEGFDDGIFLRSPKAVRQSLSFFEQEMTDPRVTQEGAALIVMEDGFRALPLLGQNERFGPSSCLKRGPNIRRERDGISDHHAGPMVQNRQKPTLPAAIDKLREIGVEHLKGVRFPFGKKAKGEIRPFGLRFSHLSREGKLKRVEKTPNPLPPPTTLRLRSSASRRRSPDTGCSRRMASLSALRASSARARLF